MSQAKKIFTRMCLNNWGGINHKVLEFNEYVEKADLENQPLWMQSRLFYMEASVRAF